ncbi:proline/glycine betaine ABC transporter permease, partial [Providencia rettgeri]|nr:proline/glycine betaine ABC transporter permease [Providencia rettgeri]
MFPELIDPRALRLPIDQFVGDLVANYSSTLRAMTQPLLDMLVFMESVLRSSPWWAVVLVVVVLGWVASRRVLFSVAMGAMLFVIGLIGLWDAAMQTLALMIVAVFLSVLIGIPLGLLMASFNWLRRIMMPVLDVMQTMPSFVYL